MGTQMNERIKLLWEQSKTSEVHPEFGEYDKYSAEKFAELIVKECADVCNKIYFEHYPDAEEWERSEEGDAIKEYFGVKE